MSQWPIVKLSEFLQRSMGTIEQQTETEYQEITVRLLGKDVA
jgi:hypothetical protein